MLPAKKSFPFPPLSQGENISFWRCQKLTNLRLSLKLVGVYAFHMDSFWFRSLIKEQELQIMEVQSLEYSWHLAICSARLAAAGRTVQVKLGQRVGRNLEIEQFWSVSEFHSFTSSFLAQSFFSHPQWKSWWIRRLGTENGHPWACVMVWSMIIHCERLDCQLQGYPVT